MPKSNNSKIKVLVVDDSAFIRKALEMMINEDPDCEVIGLAKNGKDGVEKAAELNPDVITLDVEMPIMNGLEALTNIMKTNPKPVIMISSLTEEGAEITIKALEIGAVDFIPKKIDLSSTEIIKIKASLLTKIKNIAKYSKKVKVKGVEKISQVDSLIEKIGTLKEQTRFEASKHATYKKSVQDFKIVGIGSSTGGPMALQNVIPFLPDNFPLPIVIAQHMPPMFTKSLAKRLNELSNITVVEMEDRAPLEPGVAYIGQGGTHFIVKNAREKNILTLEGERKELLYKPSVDLLFTSLADVYRNKVVGVLLTGMGKDGAMGLLKIKNMGGYTIAQDEKSSVIYGMPKAAADLGAARSVLPIKKIAEEINKVLGG